MWSGESSAISVSLRERLQRDRTFEGFGCVVEEGDCTLRDCSLVEWPYPTMVGKDNGREGVNKSIARVFNF
jgi:hypothetical protein